MKIRDIHHKKLAFTVAEAFVALAIITIVIAASIPLVTVKLNQGTPQDSAAEPWGVSTIATGMGLITNIPVVITNSPGFANMNIANGVAADQLSGFNIANGVAAAGGNAYQTSLSYYMDNPGSLLASIVSNRPLFRVGDFNFSQISNNIFITTSDVPNVLNPVYGPGQNQLTCFAVNAGAVPCSNNIFLGGNNFNDQAPAGGNANNSIQNYANNNFSNNTIIGNNNHNISNVLQSSLIVGFNNNAGGLAPAAAVAPRTVIVGNNNVVNTNNQVIIGNNITPEAVDIINIGNSGVDAGGVAVAAGANAIPLIAFDGNVVKFNRSTIVDDKIKANQIILRSDKRLKNIKGEYNKGLEDVLKVEPIIYSLKADKTNELQVGVIAQELQKIFPEAVVTMPNGYLGIDITPVFFATLNALKELDKKTQFEKERTKRLKSEYLALVGEQPKPSFGTKIKNFFTRIKNKLTFK